MDMILVPVKSFTNAKQRLAPLLSPEQRTALAQVMLEDVLRALAALSSKALASLITSDPQAQGLALRYGLAIIEDRGASSETEAVAMAIRVCEERSEKSVMIIPGDIPLLTPSEVNTVFESLHGRSSDPGVVLVPAHDGRGTNAVLVRPPGLLELRFGNDSFKPHLERARRLTRNCEVLHLPGIGLDVDNPGDVAQLMRIETRTESQRLLHSWGVPV